MKKLKTLIILSLVAVLLPAVFTSCSSDDDDEPKEQALPVTPANLDGVWQMTEWNNEPMQEGTYCYVVFHRRDNTMEMYDNLNSMYAVHTTGTFNVKQDPYLGYIVNGTYDFGKGDWNQQYVVEGVFPSGYMIWTAKTNTSDVTRYQRVAEVPAEILREVAEKE